MKGQMEMRLTINQVRELIDNDNSFDDFAVRGDNFVISSGDSFNNSWYHGDDEPEFELDGVSCISISANDEKYIKDAAKKAAQYGKYIYLVRGEMTNGHEVYNDLSECLMLDNVVVCEIILRG